MMSSLPSEPAPEAPSPAEEEEAQDVDEITRTLCACSDGDPEAFDRLIPLVYSDLRAIAHRRLLGERAGFTLDTTAVVHEAYLKLVNHAQTNWRDRAHFFAVASTVIRHVLIDYARRGERAKRGGGQLRVPLREDLAGRDPRTVDLLALDEALSELADHDERMARVVECRFFGGMTMAETASATGVPQRTAERDWTRARAYLYRMLSDDPVEDPMDVESD